MQWVGPLLWRPPQLLPLVNMAAERKLRLLKMKLYFVVGLERLPGRLPLCLALYW